MTNTLKQSTLTDFCNALFLNFDLRRIFVFQESWCFLGIAFQLLYLIFFVCKAIFPERSYKMVTLKFLPAATSYLYHMNL